MKRKSRVANKAISSYGEGFSLNGGNSLDTNSKKRPNLKSKTQNFKIL